MPGHPIDNTITAEQIEYWQPEGAVETYDDTFRAYYEAYGDSKLDLADGHRKPAARPSSSSSLDRRLQYAVPTGQVSGRHAHLSLVQYATDLLF